MLNDIKYMRHLVYSGLLMNPFPVTFVWRPKRIFIYEGPHWVQLHTPGVTGEDKCVGLLTLMTWRSHTHTDTSTTPFAQAQAPKTSSSPYFAHTQARGVTNTMSEKNI